MQIKFDSRIDKGKIVLKLAMILPLLFIIAHMLWIGFALVPILRGLGILLLGSVMSVWQLSNTFYAIDEMYLHFRSGGRRGNIEILRIERIQKCRQCWPLADASRSLDGFLIHFRHGQLFIGPKEEDAFIFQLKKINPTIQLEL